MRNDWILPVLGLVVLGLALLVPFDVHATPQTENQSTATLVVSAIVDFSINCSSISFGTFAAGTVNSSALQQCNMTIYSDTNTITNISINATPLVNATFNKTLAMDNISYANVSSPGICKSSLRSAFYSGWMAPACNTTFNDWVMIADPVADQTRNVFFFVSIPSYQTKGLYTGNVSIKVTDVV